MSYTTRSPAHFLTGHFRYLHPKDVTTSRFEPYFTSTGKFNAKAYGNGFLWHQKDVANWISGMWKNCLIPIHTVKWLQNLHNTTKYTTFRSVVYLYVEFYRKQIFIVFVECSTYCNVCCLFNNRRCDKNCSVEQACSTCFSPTGFSNLRRYNEITH